MAQLVSGRSGHIVGWVARRAVRMLTAVYGLVLWLPRRGPRATAPGEGLELLLTGSFASEGWLLAHLRPLAASTACARVTVVANDPVPPLEKVAWVRPPALLVKLLGRAPGRLAVFAWMAVRQRPHFVGAFHLLLNGLVAVAVSRLVGARSLYFCVGGTAEIDEGGRHGENRLFSLVPGPDPIVERRLLRAVGAADLVITMGTRTRESLVARGVRTRIHVIGGGIDGAMFSPPAEGAVVERDVVFVGRLVPIKRVELLLAALALVRRERDGLTATIVGDGPLREELETRAASLGLGPRVRFAGKRADVSDWLRRARVFVLTSASESLPLSAMEAMTCGLPVVAPDVGDLADLVTDGMNGCLVRDAQPESFAAAMLGLLCDEDSLRRASRQALVAASRFSVDAAIVRWDAALADFHAPISRGVA